MRDEMLRILAYIDEELDEILDEEEKAIGKLEVPYQKITERLEAKAVEVEVELNKLEPDLGKLERLKFEYQELLYRRYELDKEYAIGRETIAMIELEREE